ncbi:hypothetical protein BC940DRAFT_302140 [Gongronella butleri]|nr:hypothetical protein BC940DRAFT_302140 [Gongronella butleri]
MMTDPYFILNGDLVPYSDGSDLARHPECGSSSPSHPLASMAHQTRTPSTCQNAQMVSMSMHSAPIVAQSAYTVGLATNHHDAQYDPLHALSSAAPYAPPHFHQAQDNPLFPLQHHTSRPATSVSPNHMPDGAISTISMPLDVPGSSSAAAGAAAAAAAHAHAQAHAHASHIIPNSMPTLSSAATMTAPASLPVNSAPPRHHSTPPPPQMHSSSSSSSTNGLSSNSSGATADAFYYYIFTHQSIIQKCSDNFFLLTGYTPLELLGRSLTLFLQVPQVEPPTTPDVIYFYRKNGMTLPLTRKQSDYWTKNTLYVGCFKGNAYPPVSLPQPMSSPNIFAMDYTSLDDPNAPSSLLPLGPAVNGSNPKRKHVKDMLHHYVCMDCGTTTSPEWRRGPHGPKTLCNACGLRWSKKNKKRDFNGN